MSEIDLSNVVERAFGDKFRPVNDRLEKMTDLASAIQKTLEDRSAQLGGNYHVEFLPDPDNPEIPKMNPITLEVKSQTGTTMFGVSDHMGGSFHFFLREENGEKHDTLIENSDLLMTTISNHLVSLASTASYLKTQPPAAPFRRFMPGK